MFNKAIKETVDLCIKAMEGVLSAMRRVEVRTENQAAKIELLEKRIDEAHEIIEQLLDGMGIEAIIVPEQKEHIELESIECDCCEEINEVKKTNKRGRPRKNK